MPYGAPSPTLWVIGSANIDLVCHVSALPAPGETVMGGDLVTAFGGKGANQAVAASRLGGRVRFVGRVGGDAYGQRYRERFAAERIDTSFLFTSPRPTGSAMIFVDSLGANMIVVAPGANQDLAPQHVTDLRAQLKPGDIVLVQMEVPLETNLGAIQIANEAGARVVLNAAPAMPCDALFDAGVDVLVVNETEAVFYAGTGSDDEGILIMALMEFHSRMRDALIVTRGDEPAWLFAGGSHQEIPGRSVTPVDTVGAGDTFTGALAVAMAEGRAWADAIAFAHAAAALSTQALGAQAAMPQRGEVEALLS